MSVCLGVTFENSFKNRAIYESLTFVSDVFHYSPTSRFLLFPPKVARPNDSQYPRNWVIF